MRGIAWVVGFSLLMPEVARAQDADACATAYVAAQRFRKKAQLRASHDQLIECSKDACAAALRQDCIKWLSEVDAVTPSVVFAARGPTGSDVTAVRISMDGVLLVDHIGWLAIPVDPGPHTFRLEMAGAVPIEQRIVVREGEKARPLTVAFVPAVRPEPAAPPQPPPEPPSPAGGVPLWVDLTVGGAGVVLSGLGTYFEILGLSQKSQLCYGCSTQSQVDANRDTFRTGDILIGVGIVALAVGAYLYFFQPPVRSSTTAGASEASDSAP